MEGTQGHPPQSEQDQNRQHRLEMYITFREELMRRQLSNAEAYDNAILTLSSAAIGLSITFIRNVSNGRSLSLTGLLIGSWVLFAGAIIAAIASYFASQSSIDHQMAVGWRLIGEGDEEARKIKNHAGTLTNVLNKSSGILFILGIAVTVVFCSFNL